MIGSYLPTLTRSAPIQSLPMLTPRGGPFQVRGRRVYLGKTSTSTSSTSVCQNVGELTWSRRGILCRTPGGLIGSVIPLPRLSPSIPQTRRSPPIPDGVSSYPHGAPSRRWLGRRPYIAGASAERSLRVRPFGRVDRGRERYVFARPIANFR